MSKYQFTQDWFSWAPPVWEQLIPLLPNRQRFLEVGSFEGRSTVWIMENMMEDGGGIVCIDTWGGGEEHTDEDMHGVEERFDYNIAQAVSTLLNRKVLGKFKQTSTKALAHMLDTKVEPFDFIYIDGSHIAKDVLTDACMAWPLLKKGGVMVLDDYMWGDARDILHRPKIAIDAFCNIFAEEIEVVHVAYQLVIRKK